MSIGVGDIRLFVCVCVHEDVGMKITLSRTFVEKSLKSEYKLKMFSSYILQAGPTSFVFFFVAFIFLKFRTFHALQ